MASVPPRWQQRAADIDASAPKWIVAALLVFAAGLILLIPGGRPRPAVSRPVATGLDFQQPPDDLNPGLSGALAANGRAALSIRWRRFPARRSRSARHRRRAAQDAGSRSFGITWRAGAGPLLPHQERILEVMFYDRSGNSQKVSLTKARNRLTSRWSQVAKSFQEELAPQDSSTRPAGSCADAIHWPRSRSWSPPRSCRSGDSIHWAIRAVAAARSCALLAVGVASLIVSATITVLSNEGMRRAGQWRDYRTYLRMVAGGKKPALGGSLGRALPYAFALGLASAWAKFLKTQPQLAPAWFRALPASASGWAASSPSWLMGEPAPVEWPRRERRSGSRRRRSFRRKLKNVLRAPVLSATCLTC